MQEKYLNRKTAQELLDTRPAGTDVNSALSVLAKRGFIIEGYNDKPKETENKGPLQDSFVGKMAGELARPVEGLAKTLETYGGGTAAYIADKLTPDSLTGGKNVYSSYGDAISGAKQKANNELNAVGYLTGQNTKAANTGKEALGQALGTASLVVPVGEGAKAATTLAKVTKLGGTSASTGFMSGAGNTLAEGGSVKDALKNGFTNAIIATAVPFTMKGVGSAVGATTKLGKKGIDAVKNIDTVESVLPVTADNATKTVLNPFKDKVAKISIPTQSGYIVKEASKATPSEVSLYKTEALGKYKTYLEQSKKFVNDRSVDGGGGLDLAAKNAEKNIKLVDLKRKETGAAMGEIEKANANMGVDLSAGSTFNKFINNLKESINKGSYAGKDSVTPETEMFLNDAAKLQQRGTSVKEVLDFTRSWQNKLEDMKDKFGDFKENKFSNTNIQNVIGEMKNSVRDQLSQTSPEYQKLVKEYRLTSEFKKEANRLMGQSGLYNEPIKGTALMKRAIESNSDAGARQFLKTLRDITGYDGIADATIAIKAMKDAGDSQGLSLLGIMNQATKGGGVTGFVKDFYKGATDAVFNQEKRTQRLINKDYSPILKTVAKNPNTSTPNIIPNATSKTNISSILQNSTPEVKQAAANIISKSTSLGALKTALSKASPVVKNLIIQELTKGAKSE